MDLHRPTIDPRADNRSAVQGAIDAAHEAGGGTVELAPGPCPVAAPLELRSHVTLRGTAMTATTLCGADDAGPVLRSSTMLLGATVEELTVSGGGGAGAAVDLVAGASFCFLRRLRLLDVPGVGVRVGGGPVDHLYLEQVLVEGCGGDGIVIAPDPDAAGIFLTEVSVRSFGRASANGAAGVRTSGRAFISQLHVQPVEAGAAGLVLEPGSDHTVASNLFFGLAGGVARSTAPEVAGTTVEAELVRDLLDRRLARAFP